MAHEIKNVMVLGGRGNLGQYLIPTLVRAGFSVSVVSRSSSGARAPMGDGVSVISSDYTFPSLVEAFRGQDAVVSLIATESVKEQKTVVDAAVAAGVKRLLPSEFGSNTSSEEVKDVAPFLLGKQEVLRYVRTKEAEGLTWTAVCTGSFIDWTLEEGDGLVGWDIRSRSGTIYDGGDRPYTTTTISQVAQATSRVLAHPAETKNQYVFVSSFNVTQNQVLEALERISGTKFDIKTSTVAELREVARRHLEEGNWGAYYYESVTAVSYSASSVANFPERVSYWNELLGLKQEESFDEMIERVLKKLLP